MNVMKGINAFKNGAATAVSTSICSNFLNCLVYKSFAINYIIATKNNE